jgi:hypothetical protein
VDAHCTDTNEVELKNLSCWRIPRRHEQWRHLGRFKPTKKRQKIEPRLAMDAHGFALAKEESKALFLHSNMHVFVQISNIWILKLRQ